MNDARIAEALRSVVPVESGDWTDVLARASRAERARRRRRRLALALACALLLVTAGTTLAVGNRFFDWFSVAPSPEQAPTLPAGAPYVAGATFYRAGERPQRLSHPLLAPLLGQDVPLAVLSSGGRYLAYHSASMKGLTVVPSLYVHDDATGSDRLLARGAQTLAWSRDGRLAYFRATRARYDGRRGPFVGHVVVGTLSTPPTRWTRTAGPYSVLAWARDRLLVSVDRCLVEACGRHPEPGVYVLGRSGALRRVGLATLAALSPDGRHAFGRYDPVPGQDSPSPFVRVVDVATGRAVATLDLTAALRRARLRGRPAGSINGGDWRGDELVAGFRGESDSALVFLRMRGRRLEVESVARIASRPLPTHYGLAFGLPFFTSDTEVVVPIRAPTVGGRYRYRLSVASCSRVTRRCRRGPLLPPRGWFAVAGNPSRPARSHG